MNFVAVAIGGWLPVQQKSRVLIGLNCILLCLNNSSQFLMRDVCEFAHAHNGGDIGVKYQIYKQNKRFLRTLKAFDRALSLGLLRILPEEDTKVGRNVGSDCLAS